jgi:hypothetical protein
MLEKVCLSTLDHVMIYDDHCYSVLTSNAMPCPVSSDRIDQVYDMEPPVKELITVRVRQFVLTPILIEKKIFDHVSAGKIKNKKSSGNTFRTHGKW